MPRALYTNINNSIENLLFSEERKGADVTTLPIKEQTALFFSSCVSYVEERPW